MNLGMPEMIFIFLLALVIFGPKKLPELGRQLGKALGEFKKASNEFKNQLETEMLNIELEERAKKPPEPTPRRSSRRKAFRHELVFRRWSRFPAHRYLPPLSRGPSISWLLEADREAVGDPAGDAGSPEPQCLIQYWRTPKNAVQKNHRHEFPRTPRGAAPPDHL